MELEDEYELLQAMYPDEFDLDLQSRTISRRMDYMLSITVDEDYPNSIPRIYLEAEWVHWETAEDLVIAAREACELGTPMLSVIVGTIL
jgi:hypothetical protein